MPRQKRSLAKEREKEEKNPKRSRDEESVSSKEGGGGKPPRKVRRSERKEEEKKEEVKEEEPKKKRKIRNRVAHTRRKIVRLQKRKKPIISRVAVRRIFAATLTSNRVFQDAYFGLSKPKRIQGLALELVHEWAENEIHHILMNALDRRIETDPGKRVQVTELHIIGAFKDWCKNRPGEYTKRYDAAMKVITEEEGEQQR
jgi:hypothetical protein